MTERTVKLPPPPLPLHQTSENILTKGKGIGTCFSGMGEEQKKQGNSLVEAHINLDLDIIPSHHCGHSGELDSFPLDSPTRDK